MTRQTSIVRLKPLGSLDYIHVPSSGEFAPLPKHGHLSALDPYFAGAKAQIDALAGQLWAERSVEDWQKTFESLPGGLPEGWPEEGKDVVTERIGVTARDGVEVGVKVYKSVNVKEGAALVFQLHSGGWASGTPEVDDAINVIVANISDVVLVSVDYRLAPQHPFPTGLHDAEDALKWCVANASKIGIDPSKIILLGESAGANLAAVIASSSRDSSSGLPTIRAQALCYPEVVHPALFPRDKYECGSYVQNGMSSIVDAPKLEFYWNLYFGGSEELEGDTRHSPLLAKDFKGMPKTMLQIAGGDPLRDEGFAYEEALKADGVDVETHVFPGLPHYFHIFPFPSSKAFYDNIVKFVKENAA